MNELAEKYVKNMDVLQMKRDIIKLVNLIWKNQSIGPEDIAVFYSNSFMDLKADIVKKVETVSKIHPLSSQDKLELAKAMLRIIVDNNLEKLVRLVLYELKIESFYHNHIVAMVKKVVEYAMADDLIDTTFNAIVDLANKIGKQKWINRARHWCRKHCCM